MSRCDACIAFPLTSDLWKEDATTEGEGKLGLTKLQKLAFQERFCTWLYTIGEKVEKPVYKDSAPSYEK